MRQCLHLTKAKCELKADASPDTEERSFRIIFIFSNGTTTNLLLRRAETSASLTAVRGCGAES